MAKKSPKTSKKDLHEDETAEKEPEPVQEPKRGLIWADLSAEQIQSFFECGEDFDQQISQLTGYMGVQYYEQNPRSTILVDFCYFNLMFCKENGLTLEQTSAFYSIMKKVFDHGIYNKDVAAEESYGYFKALMVKHCMESNPSENQEESQEDVSIQLFELDQLKVITDFISTCFYRNFKAYQLCFALPQPTVISRRAVAVETPLRPPPLAAATEEAALEAEEVAAPEDVGLEEGGSAA